MHTIWCYPKLGRIIFDSFRLPSNLTKLKPLEKQRRISLRNKFMRSSIGMTITTRLNPAKIKRRNRFSGFTFRRQSPSCDSMRFPPWTRWFDRRWSCGWVGSSLTCHRRAWSQLSVACLERSCSSPKLRFCLLVESTNREKRVSLNYLINYAQNFTPLTLS